jgi:DNA-binding transcriptional regulator YdaS (Cro superfamily)
MAEATAELIDAVGRLDPKLAAKRLMEAQKDRAGWLDAFAEQLDRARHAGALERVLNVWDINQSDAARLFGVSRQAISKWLSQGVPPDRAGAIADLAAATDLLVHHLKRERIPAVVRRAAPALGNASLLQLLERQDARAVLDACRAMFAFGEAHR